MSGIPILLINLERRPDRLERMRRRLGDTKFIRIPAVDGVALSVWPKAAGGSHLSAFERACIESHLLAAREIVARGFEYACLLEDDVMLADDFPKYLETSEWIPHGVELIKLETMAAKVLYTRLGLVLSGARLHGLRSFHAGSAGYIISQHGARKMVDLLSAAECPADDAIFDWALRAGTFGEIFQMVPALCIQEFVINRSAFDSDIQPHSVRLKTRSKPPNGIAGKIGRELQRFAVQAMSFWRLAYQKRSVIPMAAVKKSQSAEGILIKE